MPRTQKSLTASKRKQALAIVAGGVALSGALFLGLAHLKMHGQYHCALVPGYPGRCLARGSYWVVGRYAWQIPVAIVVGLLGLGVAIALVKEGGDNPP